MRYVLDKSESHHLLRVCRKKVGESIIVFSHGRKYFANVVAVDGKSAVIYIVQDLTEAFPGNVQQADDLIAFAIPSLKGGKTEWLVEKLTELGAGRIIVFSAINCVANVDDNKLNRYQAVALNACKQCERLSVPVIEFRKSPADAVRVLLEHQYHMYLAIERSQNAPLLSKCLQADDGVRYGVISGPEGGFDCTEIEELKALGTVVSLGNRILRAETAPLAMATLLLASLQEM